MRVQFTLSIGFANAVRKEVIEIPDEEIRGLGERETEDYIEQRLDLWRNEYIDSSWEIKS